MSKIGAVVLELQEQANEFGFETIQEATDNGFEVDMINQKLIPPRRFNSNLEELELELAHLEWEQETNAKKIEELKKTIKEIKGE